MNTTESSLNLPHAYLFSWVDYAVLVIMLGISTIIGIYFGFFGKKQETTKDYLMGGKLMKPLPIAISIVASQTSTTTLLAVPADVYKFGSNYVWLVVSTTLVSFIVYYVYLPVFFKLQTTSLFEYLNLRFDKKVRYLASFFGVLAMIVFCPIVIYVPALAFSQVTGVNVLLIAFITSAICVFYTTIGGLKAVVWTDTFQFFIMIITFLTIFFIGLSKVGGFNVMWHKASDSGRLDILDFSFDPTLRDSFAALIIGGSFQWISFTAINPGVVQKFLSVSAFKEVKRILLPYCIITAAIHILAPCLGLLLYARYWNCDPLTSQHTSRVEQLVPQFVMEITDSLPGLPGVFIAGVFSAGLSSLSAYLNAMSAVIYKDFIDPFMAKNISQKRISNILKLIVVIFGILSTLLVIIVHKAEGIFSMYIALMAISNGPLVGLFSLGLLFPSANSKGAFYGSILSMILIAWIALENQWYQNHGLNDQFLKPVSIEGCNHTFQSAISYTTNFENPFFLYRISFWFYTFMGATISIVFGLLISYFTKHDKDHVPQELLSPVIYPLLPSGNDNCLSSEDIHLEECPLKK